MNSERLDSGAAAPPASPRATVVRRHGYKVLWLLTIVALVALQWPMVKGIFYRVSGVSAPADNIAWRGDFEAALTEARKTGKPVLIDFSAAWCPPCQVMKHDVWPDPEVGRAITDGFIPVFADVDSVNMAPVAQRYGINAIPAVVVVDVGGNVLRRANFMSRDSLLAFLKQRN